MPHITLSCGTTETPKTGDSILAFGETPSLLILDNVYHTYLPTDKPDHYAGKRIVISEAVNDVFEDYHDVIDKLLDTEVWIENRAHSNGGFKVYQGKYELTASCVYNSKQANQIFTVSLLLNQAHIPTALQLSIAEMPADKIGTGAELDVSTIEFKLPNQHKGGDAEVAEEAAAEIAEMINRAVILAQEKYEAKEPLSADEQLQREYEFDYDVDFITNNMLPVAGEKASNVQLIAFSADGIEPSCFVGYTTEDGIGVTEIKIDQYAAARRAAKASNC